MRAELCDICGNQIVKGAPNGMPKAYEIVWGYDGTFISRRKDKMDICPSCWKTIQKECRRLKELTGEGTDGND